MWTELKRMKLLSPETSLDESYQVCLVFSLCLFPGLSKLCIHLWVWHHWWHSDLPQTRPSPLVANSSFLLALPGSQNHPCFHIQLPVNQQMVVSKFPNSSRTLPPPSPLLGEDLQRETSQGEALCLPPSLLFPLSQEGAGLEKGYSKYRMTDSRNGFWVYKITSAELYTTFAWTNI